MGPRGASRSTARLLPKRSRRSEAGRIFQVPRVVQDPHSTPVSGQVPKTGSHWDAGALVNEEDNGRRLPPVTMDVFKDTLHPALYV
jgi:hypothetical protein